MVFQLIRWVDLCRSLSTWRILKNMMVLLQTDRFLHLQATLLKALRLHPHRGKQLARSQGWMVSLHKNLFLLNCVEGRERKLDGAAKKVGRLCVDVHILFACCPFCQRISRSRQAEAKVFRIMCVTQESTTYLIVLATYPLLSQYLPFVWDDLSAVDISEVPLEGQLCQQPSRSQRRPLILPSKQILGSPRDCLPGRIDLVWSDL
jgi:hypothetical protein